MTTPLLLFFAALALLYALRKFILGELALSGGIVLLVFAFLAVRYLP